MMQEPNVPPDWVDTGFTIYDVPLRPDDPNCSSHEGRRVYRNDEGEVCLLPLPGDDETNPS
jgi:hypothetical protein